jgi:hypothetical protein
MRSNRDKQDRAFWGQLFWPRPGGRDISAEVDYDRPCPNCGYNLRGMPIRARCPECGSIGGWNLFDEPVAWDNERGFVAFISTCAKAIFSPHAMARQVWRPGRFDLNAARRFRRIVIAFATIFLAATIFTITICAAGLVPALVTLPFTLSAIILWLNAVTLEPLSRLKDWSTNDAMSRRVHAVVHYLSAAFMLSPAHLILLALTSDPHWLRLGEIPWIVFAGLHLGLLMFQLIIVNVAIGWLLFELVDMPAIQAQMMALGGVFTGVMSATIMLIGIPALTGLLASRLFAV